MAIKIERYASNSRIRTHKQKYCNYQIVEKLVYIWLVSRVGEWQNKPINDKKYQLGERLKNTNKTAETLKMVTCPSEMLRRILAKHAMNPELTTAFFNTKNLNNCHVTKSVFYGYKPFDTIKFQIKQRCKIGIKKMSWLSMWHRQ